MSYDDLKEHDGCPYTGMSVGGSHLWNYTNAVWSERKVAPEEWEFAFRSVKVRDRCAPDGSGVPRYTQYHWYILAHQFVRKIDKDSYETFMSGLKYKIAHKRPHWRRWSCEYPEQPSANLRVTAILEATIARLKEEIPGGEFGTVSPRTDADLLGIRV